MVDKLLQNSDIPEVDGKLVSYLALLRDGVLALFTRSDEAREFCLQCKKDMAQAYLDSCKEPIKIHENRLDEHGKTLREVRGGLENMDSKIKTIGQHVDDQRESLKQLREKEIQDLKIFAANAKVVAASAKLYWIIIFQVATLALAAFGLYLKSQ